MTQRLLGIAFNTFRESVRNKILHLSVLFVIIMIVFSIFVGELSFYQNRRVFIDFGLFFITVLGVFLAIFIGVNLVFKEIDRKSIYLIVSKPVRRYEFLIGKYLGAVLTLFVAISIMLIVFLSLLAYFTVISPILIKALLLIFVELCVILAIAAFFSSFSTPILSGFFTFGIYLIGHLSTDLKEFAVRSKSDVFKAVANTLYLFLDFSPFSLKTAAVHSVEFAWPYVYYSCLYALFIIVLSLFMGSLAINRRDFF